MGSHRAVSASPCPLPAAPRVQSAGLPASRHHHPGVCHACLAPPPDPVAQPLTPPLLRCSQCQLVFYCSKTCQKRDWPKHRELCRANKAVDGNNVFSRAKEVLASGGSWDDFRAGLALATAVNIKRKLQPYEQEVFRFPRVCAVCRDACQPSLACCPRCNAVFYCGSAHRDTDETRHAAHCSHYLLLLECDRLEARTGIQDLPFPLQVEEVFRNLPDKLMSLVGPQLRQNDDGGGLEEDGASLDPKVVTMITERLSYPLSLLYALQDIGLGADNTALNEVKDLRVHVVGATSYTELLGIIRWEYMVHRLPALKTLHIVFIGPHLFSDGESADQDLVSEDHILDDSGITMCEECHSRQRRIVYEMANMCYQEFVRSSHYSLPDVVVAFNCGFHEHSDQPDDTWLPSLPLLVQHRHSPLVFTSYTAQEAALDLNALQQAVPIKVLIPPQENPYHSLRPYRDHEDSASQPIHFWNQFITCVRSAADS